MAAASWRSCAGAANASPSAESGHAERGEEGEQPAHQKSGSAAPLSVTSVVELALPYTSSAAAEGRQVIAPVAVAVASGRPRSRCRA